MMAMDPHHQGAIEMALDALAKSQRSEITDLARDIRTAQQAEIDLMMSLKMRCYGHSGH